MIEFENKIRRYVQAHSDKCPFCGGDSLDYSSGEFGAEAAQGVSCFKCGSEWRDTYTFSGVVVDRIGKTVPESSAIPLGQHAVTRYFLLTMFGDVEPSIDGPYEDDEARLAAARDHRASGDEDGLYRLDVGLDGTVDVGSFSGCELNPGAVE